MTKRTEAAYRHELGLTDSDFIKFGYWDGLKKGLLAGERLAFDLKRVETAYLEQNSREYEITKHVSLALLDPATLISLQQSGACYISLPEALFDLDYPGHYMRRIRSVSLTIPCVTGPYTGVNCTLAPLKSSVRHSPLPGNGHPRDPQNEDSRFTDSFGGHPVHRHQQRPERRRSLREKPKRRALPPLRRRRRHLGLAARTTARATAVRLRRHLRRRAVPALHRTRRRRCAAERRNRRAAGDASDRPRTAAGSRLRPQARVPRGVEPAAPAAAGH
jgi:Tc toxin complex TcA C-terminal TcB-binding domain